jgi:uncharacterized protein YodC (DUF2158 family)
MARHALSDFDVGDVVRLTCSSDRMTVADAGQGDDGEYILSRWFNEAGDLCEYKFAPAELIIVKKGCDA